MPRVTNALGSPYLAGNFAPVEDEADHPELAVTGAIPSVLSGLYLRNGPNPMFEPRGRYHWFDGDGMLHGIRLQGGRASYRNRWIRSRGLEAEVRAGRALYGGLGEWSPPEPEALAAAGPVKNTANTHVVRHAGRILCLMEGALPTAVTPGLETLGEVDFGGRLGGAFTAHPHVDPDTGEMLAFSYLPTLRYLRVSAAGELLQCEEIPVPKPTMMHAFAATRRHVLFFDSPAVIDLGRYGAGGPLVQWEPEHGARVGVLPREGPADAIRWLEIEPGYVLHFLNAWEQDARIVVDGCRFRRMDFGFGDASIPDPDGFLTRFHLDLDAGTVRQERLAELPGEFPRVRGDLEGRRHRYGSAATFARGLPDGPRFDSVTVYDLEGKHERTHVLAPGEIAGEPVWAPDPTGSAENDAWILVLVSDAEGAHSDLLILDAHDLAETARVHLPRRIPFGFHGTWLADAT